MLGHWMEREIGEQPRVLSDHCGRYGEVLGEALRGAEFDLVLIAARGSSDNVALYARYLFEIHLGVPVSLAAPSVLTRFGRKVKYPRCLAIGVSQSGAAPDVSEVLASMRDDGHATLAITNTAGSRLTQSAEHSLALESGPERSVAATKTYTSSLLAMYQLVRALGADLPDPCDRLPTDEWLGTASREAEGQVNRLLQSAPVFSLGRGYDFATCQEAALKLMECALIACKAYSTSDFQHGPRALARDGSAAIVFGESVPGLEQQGCTIIPAPRTVEGPLAPLWDIVFAQYLALFAARQQGLNPDDPKFITKVTETL
jgi:glutamine---fructose-6-phosphate transaminase (isomerizing)